MNRETTATRVACGLLLYLLVQVLLVPLAAPLAGLLGLAANAQAAFTLLWRAACAALPIACLWRGLGRGSALPAKEADAGGASTTAPTLPAWVFVPLFIGCALAGNLLATALQNAFGSAGQGAVTYTYQGPLGIVLLMLTSVCLPAIAEELFFRGCVQGLLQPFGGFTAVVFSALLFTLAHAPGWDIAAVLPCGLALALTRQGTGRVWPCVALHLGNNLLAFATGWLGGNTGTAAALVLAAVAVALLPLALRRVRQSGLLPRGAKANAGLPWARRQAGGLAAPAGQPLLLAALAFLVVFAARAFV